MKQYIDKLKEIETLVELSIGTTMTEEKATDIYAITNDLMCMVKKLKAPFATHRFDIERKDLYEYGKPKERTRKRLIEMAELGMEETGIASFGYKGVMSGLSIEKVWGYSDEKFKDYMDWVKGLIN